MGSLQEQQMLVTAEPFLQTHRGFSLNEKLDHDVNGNTKARVELSALFLRTILQPAFPND